MPWTEDQHNAMRVLFHAGMTARQAAEEFSHQHTPITRGSICGVWHRMGLKRSDSPDEARDARVREKSTTDRGLIQQIKHKHGYYSGQHIAKVARQRAAYQESELTDMDDMERAKHACTLFELTNTSCRWPCGDPGTKDFFFCGIPEAAFDQNRPYCRGHARVAFVGVPRRVREDESPV